MWWRKKRLLDSYESGSVALHNRGTVTGSTMGLPKGTFFEGGQAPFIWFTHF